jgi:hypothetical protein
MKPKGGTSMAKTKQYPKVRPGRILTRVMLYTCLLFAFCLLEFEGGWNIVNFANLQHAAQIGAIVASCNSTPTYIEERARQALCFQPDNLKIETLEAAPGGEEPRVAVEVSGECEPLAPPPFRLHGRVKITARSATYINEQHRHWLAPSERPGDDS